MTVLRLWWLGVVFVGPFLAFALGGPLRRSMSQRSRWAMGVAAGLVVTLAFSPLSLRGTVADQIVLGAAGLVAWLLIGLGAAWFRWVLSGLYVTLLLLPIFRVWPILFLVFVVAELDEPPFRTSALGCNKMIEMRSYGWVAHSGTEVTVLSLKAGGLLEVERGRQRFDDSEYKASLLSAEVPPGERACPVVVRYDGREIWRVW